jgi:hypothetical protein
MKTFQKLFIALCFGVTSMFSFVAFASTDTDFSNQNTEFLPGVPKTE